MKKLRVAIVICCLVLASVLVASSANAGYNSYNAIMYADYVRSVGQSYAEKANPDYQLFPYDDSTNFISQCAFYGGIRSSNNSSYKPAGRSAEKSIWYHVACKTTKKLLGFKLYNDYSWKYSSTWVDAFSTDIERGYGFFQMMVNQRKSTYHDAVTFDEVIKYAEEGDVIIVKEDGVTAKQSLLVTYSMKGNVLVSTHSSDVKDVSFRDDIDAYYRLKNPNVSYIVLHLVDGYLYM